MISEGTRAPAWVLPFPQAAPSLPVLDRLVFGFLLSPGKGSCVWRINLRGKRSPNQVCAGPSSGLGVADSLPPPGLGTWQDPGSLGDSLG